MIGITREDGTAIKVEFLHHDFPKGADFGKITRTRYRTECRVLAVAPGGDPRHGSQLGHGNSFCSVLEKLKPGQSIRASGRVRAMKRALSDAGAAGLITQEEFHNIFEAYSKRPKGKVARNVQKANEAKKAATNNSQVK